MSDTDTPPVGIVGLGTIGSHHARTLQEMGATLVGGADLDPDAREAFAEEHGVETFADAAELYDRVEAAIVAVPPAHHRTVATEALAAGVDVYVEKPLAHTLADAEAIVDAVEDHGAVAQMGTHNRFAPPARALAARREDGSLGGVEHVEARYLRRRGVPGPGTWFTREAVAGGGALMDIGVHALDLALHLAGFPAVEEVTGVARRSFADRADYASLLAWDYEAGDGAVDVDDGARAFVRCADGTTLSLQAAWAVNRPSVHEYVLQGTRAGASLDMHAGDLTVHGVDTRGGPQAVDTSVETLEEDAYAANLEQFLGAVAAGDQPAWNTVQEGLTVQRVLDAIYRSSEAGAAVAVDDA